MLDSTLAVGFQESNLTPQNCNSLTVQCAVSITGSLQLHDSTDSPLVVPAFRFSFFTHWPMGIRPSSSPCFKDTFLAGWKVSGIDTEAFLPDYSLSSFVSRTLF